MEVLCQLDISVDLNYLEKEEYLVIRENIEEIAKVISGLRKSNRKKINNL